jgi:hypothetical protein
MIKLALLLFAVTAWCFAQDQPRPAIHGWKKAIYRSSQVILGVAHAVDIETSWGKHELNPLLQEPNGTFGARGTAVKIGIFSAIIVIEELAVHKYPAVAPVVTIVNFGTAGMIARQGVANLAFPRVGK